MDIPPTDANRDLASAETLLRQWALQIEPCPAGRLDVRLAPGDLPAAVHILCGTEWGSLIRISLEETGPAADSAELVYDFRQGLAQVCLRIGLPISGGCVPRISKICWRAAAFEAQLAQDKRVQFCG